MAVEFPFVLPPLRMNDFFLSLPSPDEGLPELPRRHLPEHVRGVHRPGRRGPRHRVLRLLRRLHGVAVHDVHLRLPPRARRLGAGERGRFIL